MGELDLVAIGERVKQVRGRLTQADISSVAGIGFIRYVLPHEWPSGECPALERLAERLEASEAFQAVPIEE